MVDTSEENPTVNDPWHHAEAQQSESSCRVLNIVTEGLNNRAENSHLPTRRRERIMQKFKSPRHAQQFLSVHEPIANLFHLKRHQKSATDFRADRDQAFSIWQEIAKLDEAA